MAGTPVTIDIIVTLSDCSIADVRLVVGVSQQALRVDTDLHTLCQHIHAGSGSPCATETATRHASRIR